MEKTSQWLTICLISIFTMSCLHRADSLRMLEVRSDYEGSSKEEAGQLKFSPGLALDDAKASTAVRTAPKTANVWIFPHETPDKEYFWGGWISIVTEGDRWEVNQTKAMAPEKPSKASGSPAAKMRKGTK